ncbi:MAG: YgiQ family radical SAM protein [Candidatus Woesearchaeota archaeon]
MEYDVIFVTGEIFFDHPMSGVAILKRLLEKHNYSVAVIEQPTNINQIKKFGKPKLFFGVTSGAIDSMVRNYTPLKKKRNEDDNLDYDENVKDRAVIVYSNWIKQTFKDSIIVLGGTEATLRRFSHYDYWDNNIRKSILFDSRADILVYGSGEKQILEISNNIQNKKELINIKGTCIVSKQLPQEKFILLPSHEDVENSKEKFVDMQNLLTNKKLLVQKNQSRYVIQYPSPIYTSKDLDEYYEFDYTRKVPKTLRGFEFSVVTHRGCIGDCNFCSLKLIQGDKMISRSEKSILKEIKKLTTHKFFKGNIDDLGGPSVNMYGMDCDKCNLNNCINCNQLDRSQKKLISLLKKANEIEGIKNIYIRSGIRYDLANEEYITQLIKGNHIFKKLRIAPEHINKTILNLMNKNKGNLIEFNKMFQECSEKLSSKKQLSYYFMTAHPGSSIKEAKELYEFIKNLKNIENVQIFIPTPMTNSTCMYYTGMDLNKNRIYVPYTYNEKKKQKRVLFNN